ncbi:MAG: hypothetical protein AAFV53_26080 [Myxococcota bacterium]
MSTAWLLMGWLVGGARAGCETPISADEMAQNIAVSEAAYVQMNEDEFKSSVAAVRQWVPCISTPMSAAQVVGYYRLEALHAFLSRDKDAAQAAIRGVLAVSPTYSLPESIAPDGHPLQVLFDEVVMEPPGQTRSLSAPRTGAVWVDGVASPTERPANRPYLLQYAPEEDGAVIYTGVLNPDDPLPKFSKVRTEKNLVTPLWITAGAAAVVAGGALWAGVRSEAEFNDPATAQDDLDALRRRTNALGAVSAGAGIVAAGSGAAAVIMTRW